MNTIDLHMHSDISIDGSYTPRELAAMCCEAGLTHRFVAKEYRLLKTCGSDFHGKTKPSVHLGQCDCSEDEKQQLMHVMDRLCK